MRFALELPGTRTVGELGRSLVNRASELLDVDFASLVLVEGRIARGVAATRDGSELPWDDVVIDLDGEPSGIASAVFESRSREHLRRRVLSGDEPAPRGADRRRRSALLVPLVVQGEGDRRPGRRDDDHAACVQPGGDRAGPRARRGGGDRARTAPLGDALADALERERLAGEALAAPPLGSRRRLAARHGHGRDGGRARRRPVLRPPRPRGRVCPGAARVAARGARPGRVGATRCRSPSSPRPSGGRSRSTISRPSRALEGREHLARLGSRAAVGDAGRRRRPRRSASSPPTAPRRADGRRTRSRCSKRSRRRSAWRSTPAGCWRRTGSGWTGRRRC